MYPLCSESATVSNVVYYGHMDMRFVFKVISQEYLILRQRWHDRETKHQCNCYRPLPSHSQITVCNRSADPEQIVSYIVDELGIKEFDILPPDATHNDNPPAIDGYFIKLFDLWMDKYAKQGVRINTLDAMIQGLIGNFSTADTIGLGPIDTATFMTDGTLEPLDVLRIAGDGSTISTSNVFENPFQDMEENPLWNEAFEAGLNLCDKCRSCEYLDACGGGHLAQRWSDDRRFDNPSVYCENWKNMFSHIWKRISPTLVFETNPIFDQSGDQPHAEHQH